MSEVTHSTEARTAAAAARVAQARLGAPSGWWGMALFLATECALFGSLFVSYFFLRSRTHDWPPDGIPAPETVVPLVLAGVLVATSVPMAAAARAARRGRAGVAWLAILVALVVQTGYFALEMHELSSSLDHFTPQGSAYGSVYYLLLGAHHAHVFVGLLLNLWLLVRLAGGITNYRLIAVRSIAFYWHVVNVLGLLVVGAVLSPAV